MPDETLGSSWCALARRWRRSCREEAQSQKKVCWDESAAKVPSSRAPEQLSSLGPGRWKGESHDSNGPGGALELSQTRKRWAHSQNGMAGRGAVAWAWLEWGIQEPRLGAKPKRDCLRGSSVKPSEGVGASCELTDPLRARCQLAEACVGFARLAGVRCPCSNRPYRRRAAAGCEIKTARLAALSLVQQASTRPPRAYNPRARARDQRGSSEGPARDQRGAARALGGQHLDASPWTPPPCVCSCSSVWRGVFEPENSAGDDMGVSTNSRWRGVGGSCGLVVMELGDLGVVCANSQSEKVTSFFSKLLLSVPNL